MLKISYYIENIRLLPDIFYVIYFFSYMERNTYIIYINAVNTCFHTILFFLKSALNISKYGIFRRQETIFYIKKYNKCIDIIRIYATSGVSFPIDSVCEASPRKQYFISSREIRMNSEMRMVVIRICELLEH